MNVRYRDTLKDEIPTLPKILESAGFKTTDLQIRNTPLADLGEWLAGTTANDDIYIRANLGALHSPYLPQKNYFSNRGIIDPGSYWAKVFYYTKYLLSKSKDGRKHLTRYGRLFSKPFSMNLLPEYWEVFEIMPKYYGMRATQDIFWESFQSTRPEDLQYIQTLYDSMLVEADSVFGEFLALLKEYQRYDDALIIFTSHHGEAFMEHGSFSHITVYPECVHIPLLISSPGSQAGRLKQLVQHIDIMPTILDWAHIPAPASLQGKSIKTLLEHGPDTKKQINNFVFSQVGKKVALRSVKWTYMTKPNGAEEELYDRRNDAGEEVNIAKNFPDIISKHRKLLLEFERSHPSAAITGSLPAYLSPDIKEHILETGYW